MALVTERRSFLESIAKEGGVIGHGRAGHLDRGKKEGGGGGLCFAVRVSVRLSQLKVCSCNFNFLKNLFLFFWVWFGSPISRLA